MGYIPIKFCIRRICMTCCIKIVCWKDRTESKTGQIHVENDMQSRGYPEMAHFGGQKEGGHAPANVVSKGDYYIMTLGACCASLA